MEITPSAGYLFKPTQQCVAEQAFAFAETNEVAGNFVNVNATRPGIRPREPESVHAWGRFCTLLTVRPSCWWALGAA